MTAALSDVETTVPDAADCAALLGIAPRVVARVVTSHFHYDHIGHLALFERAQVVAAREEYAYRPLLLAADAAHFGIHVEHDWPFFAFTDLDRMRRALTRVHAVADALCAVVLA